MASIYIDVDPMEFDDDELIRELESRGYSVTKMGLRREDGPHAETVNDAAWRLRRGELDEALLIIGRNLGGRVYRPAGTRASEDVMNEDSILHPSHWPDVWEDLARFMKELEQEVEQEKQVTNMEPAE